MLSVMLYDLHKMNQKPSRIKRLKCHTDLPSVYVIRVLLRLLQESMFIKCENLVYLQIGALSVSTFSD